ncbi:hypothetical protein U1Q18_040755 [Sarracenia purpurea var. burkii]
MPIQGRRISPKQGWSREEQTLMPTLSPPLIAKAKQGMNSLNRKSLIFQDRKLSKKRCLRLVSSTSAETEPKDEENNDPGERKNSPSDGDGVDSEEEDEEEDDEDSGVTSPVSREPKMIDMEANGEKPTQAIDENEEVSEVLSRTHKNLALPQSTETPQLESWAKIVGTTLDEEENILGENEVQDEANLYEVQRNVVSPLSQSTTKQVSEIGILAHSDSSVAARRGDESELVDERDSVEEGNPRSVTPLAVGDHFGSVSSDAISDKTKKPKSSCGLERSNGAGDSVGNEGHSTGTETGKIEDEPFLDALIFGDEVIKLSSTHVDLEKREYKVASEGEVENGSKSKMGNKKSRSDAAQPTLQPYRLAIPAWGMLSFGKDSINLGYLLSVVFLSMGAEPIHSYRARWSLGTPAILTARQTKGNNNNISFQEQYLGQPKGRTGPSVKPKIPQFKLKNQEILRPKPNSEWPPKMD